MNDEDFPPINLNEAVRRERERRKLPEDYARIVFIGDDIATDEDGNEVVLT